MSATSSALKKAARELSKKATSPNGGISSASAPSRAANTNGMGLVGSFILPGSMIAPPFFRSIRESPSQGTRLQWQRAKSKFMDAVRILGLCFASKPGIFSARRLKVERRSILSTAKTLHQSMSKAFAKGDLETLRKICLPTLYYTLSSQISSRPKNIHRDWTLLSYTKTWRYPRIVDHKIMAIPDRDGTTKTAHQAIVAISSRQRLVQRHDGKQLGATKESEMVENLIMVRQIDSKTYKPGEWQVFGYAEETTYEAWQRELRALETLTK